MIDKIVDELVSQINTQLGPASAASLKVDLVTNRSLQGTSPNKTVAVVEGPMEPEDFEIGQLRPTMWTYQPIEIQIMVKGTEKEARETRRSLISLIRQTLYNDTTRAALLALTNVVGSETERVLKYNIMRIRTDVGELQNQFISIAIFQLSFTTEISV